MAELRSADSLERLYGLFGDLIPNKLFERSEKGTNSRRRSLPLKVIFWAFVAQVLSPGASCREAVRKVEAWWRWARKDRGAGLTTSAYCQARKRLDTDGLSVIGDQIAWSLERSIRSDEGWIQGRSVKIIDGTTVSMPHTPENQQAWPQPGSQKPGLGFPLLKLAGLFSLASGALLDHASDNHHVHESQLFRQMWKRLKRGDVILGDRGFCSYATLANLLQRGVDSVMRLHHARKVDFREGRRLGADDRLVLWRKPQIRSAVISDEQWAALPETLPVRLIRLQVAAPGFHTRTVVLVTTLLESQTYPAAIRALYGERWQVELHFHQIKTLMAMDVLRCKTPDLIAKKLLIHLIAYNLVHVLMQRSAHLHHVPLSRISFKGTFDTARHFADVIHAASDTPRRQQKLIDEMLALIAQIPFLCVPDEASPAPRNDGQKTISFSPNPVQRWAMSHTATAPIQNIPKPPYLSAIPD